MKKIITGTLIILALLTIASTDSYSQEAEMISPYIQLQYFKNTNDSSSLKTALTYSVNRMELPIKDMKILFYAGVGGDRKQIGEAVTNDKGVAILHLSDRSDFIEDETGQWAFSTEYAGNDTIESASADLLIQNIEIAMELTEPDSIKTVALTVMKVTDGKRVPAAGEMLTVYVPRMFSFLPIGDVILDDAGYGSLEFPADLPGDKDGNLTIIARFDEHPEFGNVEKEATLKWGVPSSYSIPKGHRALWTKVAPLWMIYTLSILLTGVWGHYMFALISLIRIKRDAKKNESGDLRTR